MSIMRRSSVIKSEAVALDLKPVPWLYYYPKTFKVHFQGKLDFTDVV